MTEQNTPVTLSDERLISDFMGYEFVAERAPGKRPLVRINKVTAGARFNESWDWLMPVVARINQLWMGCGGAGELGQMCDQVILMHISDNIERVYGAVVFFIKWYNANQPKP